MKRLFAAIFSLLLFSNAYAGVEEFIRGNAKFNVVVVVLGIIFAGIIVFMTMLSRKINKLEKEKENNK